MGAVLSNSASGQDGDPMETALFSMAREAGLIPEQVRPQSPRKGEIPFDPRRKLMTTVNEIEGHDIVFAKGAMDVLLKKCTRLANPTAGQGTGLAGQGTGAAGQRPGEPGQRPGVAIPCRTLSPSDRQRILDQNSR